MKKRYGDLHLAVGHRSQLKYRIQGRGGSRKKLAAARGRLTRRAVPARRKGHGRQAPGKDIVVQGTPGMTDVQEETSGESGMQQ
jgi:hypothetical protein